MISDEAENHAATGRVHTGLTESLGQPSPVVSAGADDSRVARLARSISSRREALPALVGLAAFACGFAILILRGCLGYSRGWGATWGIDFAKLHTAGQSWLAGANPYVDSSLGYAYPPHASLPFALYGLLPFEHAQVLNFILSVLMLWGMVVLYLRLAPATTPRSNPWPTAAQWAAAGYVMANNATTSSLFFGGIAIPAFFCASAAWYFVYRRDIPWLAGVFLAFATLKPQFSLFFCLLFLFEGRWRTLLTGAGVALAMSLPAMMQLGIFGSFSSWFDAMRAYSARWENTVGEGGVMVFDSVLAALGHPGWSVKWLAIVGFLLAFLFRHRFARIHLLVILPYLPIAFFSSHDGDYVALSFMWMGLFASAARNFTRTLVVAALVALLFVPSAIMQSAGNPFLLHWRVLTFAVAFTAYLVWNVAPARYRHATASGTSAEDSETPSNPGTREHPTQDGCHS